MKIILLSGGSGKRLWPLSNDARSKQFLKLLKSPSGEYESMVQRVARQIRETLNDVSLTIATSVSQKDSIYNQLGDSVEVVMEPVRRDTFPAIALASTFLYDVKKCPKDEVVVVMPVDTFTEQSYFQNLKKMDKVVSTNQFDLVLMSILPTYPSTKFGYIVPEKDQIEDGVHKVLRFTEKPELPEAEKLLEQNALWNGGVFAFRLEYLLNVVRKYVPELSFSYLEEHYTDLPKISFDYEVVEKAKSVACVDYAGQWKDLGTWNTLTEEMSDPVIGNACLGENVQNTHVINELDIPIVCLGTKNMVVSASLDGILVSDKESSVALKSYAAAIDQRPMYEERRWGFYKVLNYVNFPDGNKTLVKHLFIRKGCHISYQLHHKRTEVWTFVDGEGTLIMDGQSYQKKRGDVVSIKAEQLHAVKALTDLQIIEVQSGTELEEGDIDRYDWNW
ncbi:MAG: sugar phosphate nucleotidyltransferase [Paludibacteraceae bacterium]|nr:sugar phosphate nucleotidyltransferase [Paludibacteraceae bacterium]